MQGVFPWNCWHNLAEQSAGRFAIVIHASTAIFAVPTLARVRASLIMKTPPFVSVARVLSLCMGGVIVASLHGQEGLDLKVRTAVEVPVPASLGPHPTFAMLPAVEVASPEKFVRPVSETTLLGVYKILQEKLVTTGYIGVADKIRPDLLITIQYGRGYLPNPYTIGVSSSAMSAGSIDPNPGVARSEGPGRMSGDAGPTVLQRGEMNQLKRYDMNYESKMQLAAQEKLFFTIAAWNFASMQKGATRVRYWTTTVLVDDPDHRDLNQIYEQMITAAGEFLNRRLDGAEVDVSTKIREGRVEVGIPRVLDPAASKK
jgi:hypothetical protein